VPGTLRDYCTWPMMKSSERPDLVLRQGHLYEAIGHVLLQFCSIKWFPLYSASATEEHVGDVGSYTVSLLSASSPQTDRKSKIHAVTCRK
jgi:hypothetical protein